jgi:hypothetical protein
MDASTCRRAPLDPNATYSELQFAAWIGLDRLHVDALAVAHVPALRPFFGYFSPKHRLRFGQK